MSILAIENRFNVALISITIAPSTFLALSTLTFAYFYVVHARDNPQPRRRSTEPQQAQQQNIKNSRVKHGHLQASRARDPLRRPSFFRRLTARLRARQQRRPALPMPAPEPWLSLTSLGFPLGQRLRLPLPGALGFQREVQPSRVEARRPRQPQQRLLGPSGR